MAGPLDPFTPGETSDPTAGIGDPSQYENLVGQWNQFLADPRGRGALLSAGIAMMQPRGFGDTTTGQIGRAVGSAGETVSRVETADRANTEASSRQELRGAQANLAGARAETSIANANTAATRASAATDRLALMGEVERGRNQRFTTQQQVRISMAFTNVLDRIRTQNARNARENANPLRDRNSPPLPIIPEPQMQDWIRTNPPELQQLFTTPDLGGTVAPAASVTPAPATSGTPQNVPPRTAIQHLIQNPDLAPQFDEKYGPGASRRYLGQ